MRNFREWRKMTWTILLMVALAVLGVVASGFSLSLIGFSLGVLGLLCVLWYFTEPLWRQGHGAKLRRREAPADAYKPVRSLVAPRPGSDAR